MVQNSNNLGNQFSKANISLETFHNSSGFTFSTPMTFDEYKNIKAYDPNTIYTIDRGDDTYDLYLGGTLISCASDLQKEKSHYDLSITKEGKYLVSYIYFHIKTSFDKTLSVYYPDEDFVTITPVSEYNDPQEAIDALRTYSKYGFHSKEDFNVRDIIYRMIHKEITLHEAIMGILTVYSYSEWPDFQQVNKIILEAPMAKRGIDEITMQKLRHSNKILFIKYASIYDVFLVNDFFSAKEYADADYKELDVSEAVINIHNIVRTIPVGNYPKIVDTDILK